MNVIGEKVRILSSTDPTFVGRLGLVVLETANTLTLMEKGKSFVVGKPGVSFMLVNSGKIVTGLDVAGRLQDRLGRRSH